MDYLRIERDGSRATLWIDRPDKRNAFTQGMWSSLRECADQLNRMPGIRLVVVRSAAPGIFSAGADIGEYAANSHDQQWNERSQQVVIAGISAVAGIAAPTLALIDGPCIGGATSLAIACDFRAATPSSRVAIVPARIGLSYPAPLIRAVIGIVGPRNAKDLLFTGRSLTADEALSMLLIDEVAEDLDAVAARWNDMLDETSGSAVRLMKRSIASLVGSSGTDVDDPFLRESMASADYREGVGAFIERRRPSFES